ncbi:hypothetical protein MJN76_31165, partial [Salmonella enterica subsp. enterica serovar Anatum]|nr:hypothetical protein [Salmonella enterica subsp. enterica serovar Anatum]
EMNIVLSNQRFEEAERDAKNLMYQCSLATEIHHNDIFPEVSRPIRTSAPLFLHVLKMVFPAVPAKCLMATQ